jgi:hypothetical protein
MRDFVFLISGHFSKSFIRTSWLKNWIPTEVSWPSWCNNCSVRFSNEEFWLSIWSGTICENALCISTLIIKSCHHLMKSITPKFPQETLDIRTWKSSKPIKAQTHILANYRTINFCRCQLDLLFSNAFWLSLELR